MKNQRARSYTRILAGAAALVLALSCTACRAKEKPAAEEPTQQTAEPAAAEASAQSTAETQTEAPTSGKAAAVYPEDKFRTTYQVFVYSFYDSDGDGIGDLKGLTQKLDYIGDGDTGTTQDLDCSQIWVLPVFPSPTYHKYDVTDYLAIDPQYGTMADLTRC